MKTKLITLALAYVTIWGGQFYVFPQKGGTYERGSLGRSVADSGYSDRTECAGYGFSRQSQESSAFSLCCTSACEWNNRSEQLQDIRSLEFRSNTEKSASKHGWMSHVGMVTLGGICIPACYGYDVGCGSILSAYKSEYERLEYLEVYKRSSDINCGKEVHHV